MNQLVRRVIESDLVCSRDRILVGVSGGPDSVALLHVLHGMQDLHLHLEVAHLQHGLRGAEGRNDARFVAELAQQLRVPCHLREIDLPQIKREAKKGNLEELARAERYNFFAEVARERQLEKVAIGHTLDDQAETALMWFLRGAGLRGVAGLRIFTTPRTNFAFQPIR